MSQQFITGLVPAVVTPFRDDTTVNFEMIPRIVEHLAGENVAGLYALGTTGEGGLLTIEERKLVAEAYIHAAQGVLPVIIQVGHESIAESCRLADHAERSGAFALSAMAPTYFAPSSLEALVDWVAEVAAAAPTLPFYYYHIPCKTGVNFSMVDFLRLCDKRVPSLRGIKFTSNALHEYYTCLELEQNRYDVLFGFDEMLIGAVASGARGAVGSTYNIAARHANRILDLSAQGKWEEARQSQLVVGSMIDILSRREFLPALKAVMKMIGLDCGPCRAPFKTLSANDYDSLKTDLESVGFLKTLENGRSIVSGHGLSSDSLCLSEP